MIEAAESIHEQLYEACKDGNLDEVLKILYYEDNNSIKLLQRNTSDHLPYFHVLCLHGHHDIVEQLFVFDVDVNMISSYGTSPLSVACQGGDLKTVEKLIEHGAVICDPNILNINMLPIFQACHHGNSDVFNYILCQKPDIVTQFGHELLLKACHLGFLDIVVSLVSRDVDVNGISDGFATTHNNHIESITNNESPLHVACMQGYVEIIEYLLQEGAEVTTGIVEQFYNELELAVHNRYFKEHFGKYKKDFKKKVFDVDMRAESFYAIHQQWFLTSYSEHLVDIDLSNNHLHIIPKELFSLTGLKKIDVSGNELFELSDISDVTKSSLEEITVSNNNLSTLPNSFFQIESLQHLNAPNNVIEQLEQVDPAITDAYLNNDVTWRCSLLKSLNLSKNKLHSLPVGIQGASSLEKLLVTDNKLGHFPVAWRSPMRILDLSKNNLQDFEESIFTAWKQTLEDLNLSHNMLTTIAWDICQIDTLQRLNMSHNKIECMPPMTYWTCKNLRRLSLSYNMLCGVHYSLTIPRQRLSFSLSSPTHDIDVKKEDFFPYEVFGTTLEALFLDHNQLNEIPISLCQLRNLEELDLSWNPKLKTLPNELGNLVDCHILGLEGLHLTGIPRYVQPGRIASSKDLLTFLRAKERKAVPYNRMKLMVVGHQGRGKTTLLAALRGKPLPANISTVGIVVGEWTLSTSNKLFNKSNITFSTWDLAGQQVYYSTHQCFLSSNTLYLAVWNASHGDEGIDKLKPWLLNVQARAPGSSVIIIGTHVDLLPEKTKKMRSDKLKQEVIKKYRKKGYPLIKGNFLVSSTTGENMLALRRSICEVALQIKECSGYNETLIGRMVPLSYLKLQENVMKECEKRRNEVKVPILNEKEMLELAAQDPNNDVLTRDELLLAARFLHENGVILHYNDRSRGLDQLFFIEPEWLCDIMALLVTVKESNNLVKDGIIQKCNIKLLLRHPRLPQKFMEQYIQLMERFEVALILDAHYMLIPSMLPREKPGLQLSQLNSTPTTPTSEVSGPLQQYLVRLYKMNYVPSGFWSRLIARLMIAVQKWGVEEADLSNEEVEDETMHSSSIRPLPCGYSLIYWREGIGVIYNGGHLMVESFTDKERHSFTEALEDIEGVKVTVWSAEQDFSVLGFITDQINSLIAEWYPGLEENDNFGIPLVRHMIPCPTCVARADTAATTTFGDGILPRAYSTSSNLKRTTSYDSFASFEAHKPQEFSLTECAAAAVDHKEITCPNHLDEPVRLDCLVPDLTLSDLPDDLLIDPTYFSFNPVDDNRLGSGGAGEVFLGTYKKQRVAIKRFYSTKESWRHDSGIHSAAYHAGNSRYTDGSVSSKRAVFTTPKKVALEEELQRSKILSSFWELRQEVTVLARLNHPCVVSLVGVCVQPLSIVLELSPLGSLYSILEKELKKKLQSKFSSSCSSTIDIQQSIFNRELTYRIVYQVINALCYLHEAGVIYRDLKSDNLLVWSLEKDAIVHIKLSDYGISRFATPQGMLGEEGTPGFQAPEIRHGATYNEKVDIFSFAMVIYEILSGYRPYHECRSSSQIKKAVRQGDRPSLQQICIDSKMPELESLMTRSWRENMFARPSAVDIVTRMQDASFLCLTRVLPYADQKPWNDITAFVALSSNDEVFDDSSKGTESVLIWGGENEERYYSVVDCNTGFVQLPETLCSGSRVSSIAKVGDRFWLGTEGLSIDVFGRPKFSDDLRVLWSFKLKAPVLSLLVDKQLHDFCVRRVFASLANGRVAVISQGKDRKSFSTSSSFYFRSDATEKLRQEAAIFSVLTTIDVGDHQTPVCCMVFVNEKQQLWLGCANHISVLDLNSLIVIHKFRAYVSPRTNVRAMVTDGHSVFTINRQTAIIRQWDTTSYNLLYNFNCDVENPHGLIISTKMTNNNENDDRELPVEKHDHDMVNKSGIDHDMVNKGEDNPKIMPDIPRIHRHQPSLMLNLKRSSRHRTHDHLKSTRIRSRALQGVSHMNQRITCVLVVDGMLWLGRGSTGDILVVDITEEDHGRVLGVLSLGLEQGFIKREINCLQLIGGNYILSCGNLCRAKRVEQDKITSLPSQVTSKRSFMTGTSPFKTMLKNRKMEKKDEVFPAVRMASEQRKETNQLAIWLRWQKKDFQRFFNYHEELQKTSME